MRELRDLIIRFIKMINIKMEYNQQHRITCLLGAGAVVDIGGPFTDTITQQIEKQNPFIAEISLQLKLYYGDKGYNFEDVFHAIESLRSYSNIKTAVKGYKPILGAFTSQDNPKYFDSLELIKAEQEILEILSKLIVEYDNQIMKCEHNWYINFWRELNNILTLDIFTLNYDSTIQKSLIDYTDGYEEVKGSNYFRFNPSKIIQTQKPRVINLHGSIYYGYLNDKDINRYILEDDFNEMYKYNQFKEAKETWTGRSSNYTQSGEIAQISPIITGLRKTDKLLTYPMSVYNNIFMNSVFTSPNLLVCGYSFGDKHINKIIEKITSIHGQNRKIVLITYINDEAKRDWTPDTHAMEWLDNDTFIFIAKAFNESRPFENKYKYSNPMISKDGRVQIYFEGFKNTIEYYKEDIIKFFKD